MDKFKYSGNIYHLYSLGVVILNVLNLSIKSGLKKALIKYLTTTINKLYFSFQYVGKY